jgi:hypothetical protein
VIRSSIVEKTFSETETFLEQNWISKKGFHEMEKDCLMLTEDIYELQGRVEDLECSFRGCLEKNRLLEKEVQELRRTIGDMRVVVDSLHQKGSRFSPTRNTRNERPERIERQDRNERTRRRDRSLSPHGRISNDRRSPVARKTMRAASPERRVHVSNFSFESKSIAQEKLLNFFRVFGEIEDCYVDPSLRWANLTFAKETDARRCSNDGDGERGYRCQPYHSMRN